MPGERTRQLGRPFRAFVLRAKSSFRYKVAPKFGRVRKGVGWSHSTGDSGDNITSEEGRAPAVGAIRRRKGRSALRELTSAGSRVQDLQRKLGEIPEFPQESRVRENLTHGLMRGVWRPGMATGLRRGPKGARHIHPLPVATAPDAYSTSAQLRARSSSWLGGTNRGRCLSAP